MEITHLPEDNLFKTVVDGYTAYVTYIIRDGKLDIRHTIVPPEIGGRGIAAQLVKATYDYALNHHLQPSVLSIELLSQFSSAKVRN